MKIDVHRRGKWQVPGARQLQWALALALLSSCTDSPDPRGGGPLTDGGGTIPGADRTPLPVPSPACEPAGGGGAEVSAPVLTHTLKDADHGSEAWLASPAALDLDGDGKKEIIGARSGHLIGWSLEGAVVFHVEVEGRIWASPIAGELLDSNDGPELAVAARGNIHAWDARGNALAGFPFAFRDEMRAIAAGDIDGDGQNELVAVTTNPLRQGGQKDIIIAVNMDGSPVPGFPPNTTDAAGCDDACFVTGGYDQTLALGDVNGDKILDILAPQDNAYISLHEGSGRAFDAASIFNGRTKFSGIRMLHDYALAQQGYADDEDVSSQGHFTNSAPAITDVNGDGVAELVVLGSVQNAGQSDRLRGVALWVLNSDGTRPAGWTEPYHAAEYLSGLWDFKGTNIVGATNQVSVADLDPDRPGPEFIFAGFDGHIHCVDASRQQRWRSRYTDDPQVLTGGVVVTDLSGDGSPEIIFATYSTDEGKGKLHIWDAGGNPLHETALPGRGAMAVPTIDDLDGDGTLEIMVNLKNESTEQLVLVFNVPGSSANCLLWPSGRGNWQRNGYVP